MLSGDQSCITVSVRLFITGVTYANVNMIHCCERDPFHDVVRLAWVRVRATRMLTLVDKRKRLIYVLMRVDTGTFVG